MNDKWFIVRHTNPPGGQPERLPQIVRALSEWDALHWVQTPYLHGTPLETGPQPAYIVRPSDARGVWTVEQCASPTAARPAQDQ